MIKAHRSDPEMLESIATYLRSRKECCPQLWTCADLIQRVADNVSFDRIHNTHMIDLLEALAGMPARAPRVEAAAHAVINRLPAWMIAPISDDL